jgi:hypothetical protein
MTNKIWYPGSAYSDLKWIQYLQETFKGDWLFSDINNFDSWDNIRGSKKIGDTLVLAITQKSNVNTLIISRHPNFRDIDGVIDAGILNTTQPQVFIYDPGSNPGVLEEHYKAAEKLQALGYSLKRIVLIPDLYHQYCEFIKLDSH